MIVVYESAMVQALYARYGGRSTVTVLAGDGIGPEMLKHVTKIFQFANVSLNILILIFLIFSSLACRSIIQL